MDNESKGLYHKLDIYEMKYLKYKLKYLNYKKYVGGAVTQDFCSKKDIKLDEK